MNVFSAVEARRSMKHFDPEHKMTDDEIEKLMQAAALSPTAFNIQNWRFVIVKDKELRKKIRAVSWDQAQVTDASILIILCADLKAWEKNPIRYWRNADKGVQDFIIPAIDSYYRGKDDVQRDEAMRSCGIAAQTLMLCAKEMGYDSCPMDGFDFEAVGKLINLPKDHIISLFVAIGKAIGSPWPRSGSLPLSEIITENKF